MALSTSAVTRRLGNAMAHAGHTVTISGTNYVCFPVSMRDNELRNRGQTFRDHYRTSIALLAEDVDVNNGDTVTYNGTERRVLDIPETADGLQQILHLGDKYGDT